MYKKKLIETSIPLDAINEASAGEKNIRKGYPATLHLWWARRPLAAARCVIFASMVDDPEEHPELFPSKEEQDAERERLHGIIRRLANWDNINDEELYAEAHAEMVKYAPDGKLPEFLDPFAGGGALPLEAQRLGLVSHAADLNPVPVTINRAMIDIPARFCGQAPVHPGANRTIEWPRATGLAEDVSYYANLMREHAIEKLGANYPDIEVSAGGTKRMATPIAYIWARTVKCPNPACQHDTPLVRSFVLAKKKGHRAYIDPEPHDGEASYRVRFERNGWTDFDHIPEGTVGRRGAVCLHCGSPISLDYIRAESREHGLGEQMMATVSENPFGMGRWYSAPTESDIKVADIQIPLNVPNTPLPEKALSFRVQAYGLTKHKDLFSPRQLKMLVTLSDLVSNVREIAYSDARTAGMADDGRRLEDGGSCARAYAEGISVYLAFVVDKITDFSSTICTWNSNSSSEAVRNVFARQALPMTWDYAESNPFGNAAGSFDNCLQRIVDVIRYLPAKPSCDAVQRDAQETEGLSNLLVSTDPPYYDNIGYSDLSDYFYVWMRRSLRNVFPKTFSTMLTPKTEELIATPYRFGGSREKAKGFFEKGMCETFLRLANSVSQDYPMTIFYAYKQAESSDEGRTSSGWETMLQALMNANLQITGTWPIRTERVGRTISLDTNALASSIVLVCRKRDGDAPVATRPEFQRELRKSLREGVEELQGGSIAPVDMAQAAIGPGMAAFSKFSQVLESDGTPMSVHTALGIINEQLDALMGESGESFDSETRFCVTWYEQFGFEKGDFGTAETLRNARRASFTDLVHSGVLINDGGKTWLVRPTKESATGQTRLLKPVWANLMGVMMALDEGGNDRAAEVLSQIDRSVASQAKSLAYVLFQSADRKGRTADAALFNDIVTSWADIAERAEEKRRRKPVQAQLEFNV